MSLINMLVYCALAFSVFTTLFTAILALRGDEDVGLFDVVGSLMLTAVIAKVAAL